MKLTSGGTEATMARVGTAIVTIYSMLCCCIPIAGVATCKFEKAGGIFGLIAIVCSHLCWLILGPTLLSSANSAHSALKINQGIVNEFEIINECGDSQAHVNMALLE